MSKWRNSSGQGGNQVIGQTFAPDSVPHAPNVGSIVEAYSPYWGAGEFIYVRFEGNIRAKGLVSIDAVFENGKWITTSTEVPFANNMGRPVGVAVLPAAAGQYGWVQIGGLTPVSCSTQGPVGGLSINSTGQAGGASPGKQVNNLRCVVTSAHTAVKVALEGRQGENIIKVSNTDGWFVGAFISGTGIAAGATIAAIDNDEKTVTLSANNTAPVTGNITATYNNGATYYNICMLQRPTTQPQIT